MNYKTALMAVCAAATAVAGAAAGNSGAERLGAVWFIGQSPLYASLNPSPQSGQKHTVIEGENDWKISKRHGVTVTALHGANPGVNWRGLQIGQKLNVPGGGVGSTPSKNPATKARVATNRKHTVSKGENDVVIAKKYGVKLTALHSANPSVNWRRLQIGQKINVSSGTSSGARMTTAARITSDKVRTTKEGVRIRREPSTESSTRTTVDKGTVATVLDRKGEWYELRFPKGTVGWVRGDMLTSIAGKSGSKSTKEPVLAIADEPVDGDKAAQLISTAKTLLGVRYKWGGTSRGGVDCSGFTSYVFAKSGIRLPRTSIEQSKIGLRVDKVDLESGDLLFFKTGLRSSRINHVGMYVGGGKFIHASSHRRQVVVSSLGEYSGAYAGARRLPALQAKAEAIKAVVEEAPVQEGPPEIAPKTEDLFPSRVVVGADKPLR